MFDLSGRTALITGAGQGMGLGIASALAEQGAHVILNDLLEDRATQSASALSAKGLKVTPCHGDIIQPETVNRLIEVAEQVESGLDILVHNAGVPVGMPSALRSYAEMEMEDYERQLDLNFRAIIALNKAALPKMVAREHGRILVISSESWRLGQSMGLTDYASAKAASIGYARTLSAELGPTGVTVNTLSLGAMNNHGYDDIAAKVTAVGRAGTPEDVGAAAVYLVSNEASWVTGQMIAVNGGSCTA